jgi:type II restriction enzyme
MIDRLKSLRNPNLILLHYDPKGLSVTNLIVVPKHFFVPEVIERRPALSPLARRAGWVGCNILLKDIPQSGRIFLVRDRIVQPTADVLLKWQSMLFLRDQKDINSKGWLLSVMKCVERIGKESFSINEVYSFEQHLRQLYPSNRHIKDKIRQQLQVLRDKGYLEFLGRGDYRLATPKAK